MEDAELEQLTAALASGVEKKLKSKLDAIEAAPTAMKELEKKIGDPGRWDEHIKKLESDAKQLQEKLKALEVKAARPALGPDDEKAAEIQKAFGGWIRKGTQPEALKELATDDQSKGGYLVPDGFRASLIEKLVAISPIRANASVQTISVGDEWVAPTEEGEFAAKRAGERSSRPATDTVTFGQLRIPLHELYARPEVTQKLLDDSGFNVEDYISRSIARRVAKRQNKDYIVGTGMNEPEGILTSAKTKKVETATAATLVADDVLNLIYEVEDEFAQGSQLYANRKIVLALRKLKDDQKQYLWQPSLANGEPGTFAGVPVVRTPDMDATVEAGNNVLMYGNLGLGYQIVDKSTVPMLRNPYTNPPFVSFYTTWRDGGKVIRGDALARLEVKA